MAPLHLAVTLREPTFLILTALAPRPLHGYGIIKDIETISADRVVLRAGTLYTALDRLCGGGWVEVDHEEVVDGRLRRYYRLSDTGADELATETKRRNTIATRVYHKSIVDTTTPWANPSRVGGTGRAGR